MDGVGRSVEGLATVGTGAGCGSAWIGSSWRRRADARSRRACRDGVMAVVVVEEEEEEKRERGIWMLLIVENLAARNWKKKAVGGFLLRCYLFKITICRMHARDVGRVLAQPLRVLWRIQGWLMLE